MCASSLKNAAAENCKEERTLFMKISVFLTVAIILAALSAACSTSEPTAPNANTPVATAPPGPKPAGPLPDSGFKAVITIADPPTKLRAGQKETIKFTIKNTSDAIWWQRGGETTDRTDNLFYLAAGNRWIDKDGKPTGEEGHNGIPRDLRPGEEAEMTLEITAPKAPGEYILHLDMVQEGVSWFSDKGSPVTSAKVTVVQ
jgi:hypothetical protein